jgi:uncharacterized damage-inducible protein DinB
MSDQPDYPVDYPLVSPPGRSIPPREAGERETLTSFLDFQRATLAVKCAGLTADQLRIQPVPPSSLSLLGLVRHMAEVERSWFATVLDGQPMDTIFTPGLDPERAFSDVADADVAEALAVWETECARARELAAAAASLDVAGDRDGRGTFSLRWILVHMIEEYARHNGHADLIRERIDGATGQ